MYRWRCLILLLLITMVLAVGVTVYAQSGTTGEEVSRPKIGLALGGGSAGGFAHIGVLMWLEEHRIPIDYLAGTSMGGLMGGCYATGMTPAEITTLVNSVNWSDLFDPNPPYSALDFRRKEDLLEYPLLEIGYRNNKVRLPSGLSVYRIDLVLSRIASPYPASLSFNQFPTPFKCVATDIKNYKTVVFEKGSLKEALRATMSIPGVFTPVVENGRILVDGGILNNVPVEIVKQMGSDVVIAVNIAAPVSNRESESIDSILSKTIDTVLADNSSQSLRTADVIIAPSFDGLGLLKWDAAARYIELGYQAANHAEASLLKYALSPEEWQNHLTLRQARRRIADLVPQEVIVQGASEDNAVAIRKQLKSVLGKPFDPVVLENELTGLMGSGLYESLSYEFTDDNPLTILKIKAKEKTYGPPFIRFGVNTETSGLSSDNYELNLTSRLTAYNILGFGSELRFDLELGTEAAFAVELYKPLSSGFFMSSSIFSSSNNYSFFTSKTRTTDYRMYDEGFRVDLGYSGSKESQFRLGYVSKHQSIKTKVGEILPESLNGEVNYAEIQWVYRSGEKSTFPGENLLIQITADQFHEAPGTNDRFHLTEAKLRWNIPFGPNDSLITFIAAGTSSGTIPLPQQFKLGGPFRLSAYSFDEFQGENYVLGTLGYVKLIPRWSKRQDVYASVWFENGATFDSWSDFTLISDLSLGLITPTLLGPFTIGISVSNNSHETFFVVLGHIF